MNQYTGSSLTVLNEALDISEKFKESIDPGLVDTVTESSSSSLDASDQSSSDAQLDKEQPCSDRLMIEIKDPLGRCVELEKQLDAVMRAIVEPLEREIARIKNCPTEELGSPEIQELEVVLMPALSILSEERNESWGEEKREFSGNDSEVLSDPLVDQSLRRHTERELLAMRDSLEVRKEWKSYYAYHLERFRQMHAAVVNQYHDKLIEVDQRCRRTEEELHAVNRDLTQVSQVAVERTKEVVHLEREKEQVQKELDNFKRKQAKRLIKIGKEHYSIKTKLESELKDSAQEIESLEADVKKYEAVKKESRSSKRLNAVLNDKLRIKTKEVTDLFAENLKLREQGMLLRRDLTSASEQEASLAQSLESAQQEKTDLEDQFKLHVIETESLLESQREELERTHGDLERLRVEISQLHAGTEFEREINEGLCETLEGALQEAVEKTTLLEEMLLDVRQCNEYMKQELSLVTSEFESEREHADDLIKCLQAQLEDAEVVKNIQESDLDESHRLALEMSNEVTALKSDLESERKLNSDVHETMTSQLSQVLALNEHQEAQILETESRIELLEAESVRQQVEIELLQGEAAQLSKEVDSQRERSAVLVISHAEGLKQIQEINASLIEEMAAIKSAFEPEREAAAEETESLKVEVGGLQMDNALLEYEISQLKAHLETVMEENVLLSDNAFEAGEFNAREQSDFDFNVELASFDMEETTSLASSSSKVLYPSPLSQLMQRPSLSQGTIDANILAAFGELDQALRSNEALLNQVSEAGLTPEWEPRISVISIAVDEHGALCQDASILSNKPHALGTLQSTGSVDYSQVCEPSTANREAASGSDLICAPVSQIIDSATSANLSSFPTNMVEINSESVLSNTLHVARSVEYSQVCVPSTTNGEGASGSNLMCAPVSQIIDSAALANLSSSPTNMVEIGGVQSASGTGPHSYQAKSRNFAVTSMPSDEDQCLRNDEFDMVEDLQATCVTKTSMVLADHLMGVLEGKEGSDDAVLEEMDKLRILLFDLENAESHASEESDLEAGMEVTLDDFIARDQWDHAFVNNDEEMPLPRAEEEWFERMMRYAVDFDSECEADDASRDKCPDLADAREGEDCSRIHLEVTNDGIAFLAHGEDELVRREETHALSDTTRFRGELSILQHSHIQNDWNMTAAAMPDNAPGTTLVATPKGGVRETIKLVMDMDQENTA